MCCRSRQHLDICWATTGETAAYGLTNGIYLSSKSFKTVKRPIATVSLVHSSIPDTVIGSILREQQEGWVGAHMFEFAERLPTGHHWPAEIPFADRIEHPNHNRYVIRARRRGYVFYGSGQGDLPVYKESRNRIHGPSALLGSAHTFDPRKGALNTDVPCVDVSRHVCDSIVEHWARMCGMLRARPGADKVAHRLVAVIGYTATGMMHTAPALRPHPVSWQWISPDLAHSVMLNSAVSLLWFVKEMAMKVDSRLVCECSTFCQ